MASTTHDLASGATPQQTFPNAHLAHASSVSAGAPAKGANPAAAFPNEKFNQTGGKEDNKSVGDGAAWSAAEGTTHNPADMLREAVANENWAHVYEEGKATMQANAGWSANAERCNVLQCLCTLHGATRVLEIGSFCGVAALAMAEALPKDGAVVSLELEPYFVEFGKKYKAMSKDGSKITTKVGPAVESMKDLAEQVKKGSLKPFDMVIIDGDKATMKEYYGMVRASGLATPKAVVCLDVTPFKGQPPTRYVKFGATEKWESSSGEDEIAEIRKSVREVPDVVAHEFGGLLVVQHRGA